jgi:hypothetical protein
MKKISVALLFSLFLSLLVVNHAKAQTVNTTHIICFETTQDILGLLNLECNISTDEVQSDPYYQMQISFDGKSWKDTVDTKPFLFNDYYECPSSEEKKIAPLLNPTSPQCFVFRLMYQPLKVGSFSLRLAAVLDETEYLSNSVDYFATKELIAEQQESRAIDARNRSYVLSVKWPYKIPVGTPYNLVVTSKDKYSGTCTIRSITGSPISLQKFNMKNGSGKTKLRGLKTGNARVNITCKKSSGSGPYASSYADVYFSK